MKRLPGKRLFRFLQLTMLCFPLMAVAQAPRLGPTALPPMGWSSWNSFSNTIDSSITMAQADALHRSGLQKAGYVYVNIDEGWWLGARDADGNIVVDPKAWPAIRPGERAGDMSNIVRYIHSLGLKAGIYTDAGRDGCSMYPDIGPGYFNTGSEGHYEQDFLQFARWGFDYVKVDWCGGAKENLDPDFQYAEIVRALSRAEKQTGHKLYFSICEWGKQSPFTWAPGVGGTDQAIWRSGGDIVAPVVAAGPHAERKVPLENIFRNFDANNHPEAQHTGYYNDADMMVVGMPSLNRAQNRLHLSLWAIAATPLLIGADLTRLDAATVADLTNPVMVAIDQDPLGLQAVKVAGNGAGLEVWSKFLSGSGERAVLLLNRTYFPAPMHVSWRELGLQSGTATVSEVWTGKTAVADGYAVTVPAQDAVLLVVRGTEGRFAPYAPTEGQAASAGLEFSAMSGTGAAMVPVRINYRNPGEETRIATVRVNAQASTRIALPPGGPNLSSVWIEVRLDGRGNSNRIRFTGLAKVRIESIDVGQAPGPGM